MNKSFDLAHCPSLSWKSVLKVSKGWTKGKKKKEDKIQWTDMYVPYKILKKKTKQNKKKKTQNIATNIYGDFITYLC